MTDQLIDPSNPADLEFVRAGAEKVVATMGNDHRARAAMIYSHIMALTKLIEAAGDGAELAQGTIEALIVSLPQAYKYAFMLDTLSGAEVAGFDSQEIMDQALARTERGRMQKPQQLEYKVMTVALTNAQETACALGKAGWTMSGQSTPVFPPRRLDDKRPPEPPAVTFSFERVLRANATKQADIDTQPASEASDGLVQLRLSDGGPDDAR